MFSNGRWNSQGPNLKAGSYMKDNKMDNNEQYVKGIPFNLEDHVSYADGSVVSQTLLKKEIGNITLFSFDSGQGLSEHTAPFDAVCISSMGRRK